MKATNLLRNPSSSIVNHPMVHCSTLGTCSRHVFWFAGRILAFQEAQIWVMAAITGELGYIHIKALLPQGSSSFWGLLVLATLGFPFPSLFTKSDAALLASPVVFLQLIRATASQCPHCTPQAATTKNMVVSFCTQYLQEIAMNSIYSFYRVYSFPSQWFFIWNNYHRAGS